MKKILSLILALLMIVSCASFIFAEEAVTTSEDVAEAEGETAAEEVVEEGEDETASKYYDAVKFLVNYDIMHGKGDKLGVYDNIKRYEMALFIGRICTGWVADDQWEDGPENTSAFVDLAGTAAEKYYGAISYVNGKGIVVGVGGNRFAPEAGIKYEDALTMAVRALGYNDLAYPWGYIETAVNLGLTDGIEGVAYSETLKREVVAQIIYNALFAECADGSTLAKKNFNLDLKYETVMITACDGGVYGAASELAPAGYVAYQIFEADGTLGTQVYLTTAESFGLTGEHDDEKALGTLYKAVFNKNTEYGLGQILSAESLEMEAVLNEGINSKSAGKYPIQAFLEDYKIVSKYSAKTAFNADVNEIIIVTDGAEASVTISDLVAIDWYNGNILVKNSAGVYEVAWYYNELLNVYFRRKENIKDNGDITTAGFEFMTVEDAQEIYGLTNLEITLTSKNCFAPVKKVEATAYAALRIFDANEDGVADYGIYDAYRFGYLKIYEKRVIDPATSTLLEAKSRDVMTASTQYDGNTYNGGANAAYGDGHSSPVTGPENDAAFAPESDFHSERGKYAVNYYGDGSWLLLYHQGKLGFAMKDTLEILDLSNAANGVVGKDNTLAAFGEYIYTGNGYGGAYKQFTGLVSPDAVWFAEDSAPVVDEDGNLQSGYMIYTIDPSTRELKVMKNIGAYEEGSDTYVATGILRAYNTTKKTVTIGDTTFSTSYDDLAGSAFRSEYYRDGVWYLGSQYFRSLLNQFVTYVVVDDKVVYVEASGDEDYRFLVVESFAGISSDGYVVINAWDTADGACKRIRIASVDGWMFGDIFYYSQNYDAIYRIFEEDTVLQILSYNPETDAYGVTEITGLLMGTSEDEGIRAQKYSASSVDFTWFNFDYRFAATGIVCFKYLGAYRADPKDWAKVANGGHNDKVNGGNAPVSTSGLKKNLTEDDRYVFIFAPGELAGSPIRIYEGKVTNSEWFVKGWRLNGPDSKTHIFMGLTSENVNGFDINKTAANHTLVMIPDYKNPADTGSWYLPELGKQVSGFQVQFGDGSGYIETADNHPWGYVTSAAYDEWVDFEDWYLLGNTEYEVVVLNLRTLHTETVKVSDRNMKANYIYEVIDGKVVGEPHDANELYDLLIGTFGHSDVDLDNDLVELFTTTWNTYYRSNDQGTVNDKLAVDPQENYNTKQNTYNVRVANYNAYRDALEDAYDAVAAVAGAADPDAALDAARAAVAEAFAQGFRAQYATFSALDTKYAEKLAAAQTELATADLAAVEAKLAAAANYDTTAQKRVTSALNAMKLAEKGLLECNVPALLHSEYTSEAINRWLTNKWVGAEYTDFGSYTIVRKAKYASVVTVYEATDGHAELVILGTDSGDGKYYITANQGYGWYDVDDVYKFLGNTTNIDVATVTVVNMDNVKLGTNLSPYGAGLAAVTYIFDATNGVDVDYTYAK